MTVFDTMLATMFADPNIATDVLYTSSLGASNTIRAIRLNPMDDDAIGGLKVRSGAATQVSSVTLDVAVTTFAAAGLPMPQRGDVVVLDGALTYQVRGVEIEKQGIAFRITLGRGET